MGVYVLAVVAGIASNVPAGLGVFESVLLLALPGIPRDGLLAAILAYRAIYYLAPLALAALLAAERLVRERRGKLAQGLYRVRGCSDGWPHDRQRLGIHCRCCAVVLGSTPVLSERMALLRDFVPLPLLEASHLTGSLAGLGLVILARACTGAWMLLTTWLSGC